MKTDGRMWGWGDNYFGQVGTGSGGHVLSPEPVGELTWIEVAAGGSHTLAITTDEGKMWGLG